MQYSRCKCGKAERWCSGYPIHPCEGCEDCGTTLSFGPENHKPLQPHKWQEIKEIRIVGGILRELLELGGETDLLRRGFINRIQR